MSWLRQPGDASAGGDGRQRGLRRRAAQPMSRPMTAPYRHPTRLGASRYAICDGEHPVRITAYQPKQGPRALRVTVQAPVTCVAQLPLVALALAQFPLPSPAETLVYILNLEDHRLHTASAVQVYRVAADGAVVAYDELWHEDYRRIVEDEEYYRAFVDATAYYLYVDWGLGVPVRTEILDVLTPYDGGLTVFASVGGRAEADLHEERWEAAADEMLRLLCSPCMSPAVGMVIFNHLGDAQERCQRFTITERNGQRRIVADAGTLSSYERRLRLALR